MGYIRWWPVLLGLLGLALVLFWKGMIAMPETSTLEPAEIPPGMARATFGSGCFWCTEAMFQDLKGVHKVVSGYTGGSGACPSYRQVCGGDTGHAEAIQVTYDPAVISYEELLEVFWKTHDPTTKDRQGNDVGTQYRSVIFYHSEEQRKLAEHWKKELDESGVFARAIVTEIAPCTEFYRAETYHQNYYADNPGQGYCQAVIRPKVDKLHKLFADKLKGKP